MAVVLAFFGHKAGMLPLEEWFLQQFKPRFVKTSQSHRLQSQSTTVYKQRKKLIQFTNSPTLKFPTSRIFLRMIKKESLTLYSYTLKKSKDVLNFNFQLNLRYHIIKSS
ncbi:uncharacterized protein ASCRUDRAFT_110700 [Ascoidea rubescens DSM 1968]|uniref:Uncharacterized protein n=1 Tax=Ascoidea rubescens DSM 1968 TaxID=1344418 RepID=A0A1D2VDH1_9ASCO|nr:hypothetical protein ASCRUDRAFT_110700 [Ascoidea rubescens DSM 1968]ODV59686.1 hypothetical protein ASCRUDRAFT_110700 [Ascoidea rubescens DSM 1968]